MEGRTMKRSNIFSSLAVIALMVLFLATNSISSEYRALEDVESTDVVFDFRIGDPQTALAHLNLIHDMTDDKNMVINDEQPEIVIVFIGPSVKLVSTDQSSFDNASFDNDQKKHVDALFLGDVSKNRVSTSDNDQDNDQKEHLDALADKISDMYNDGVEFEICLTAAHAFDVDPDTILPEITKVKNGWITVIGYQQKGYAMIADF